MGRRVCTRLEVFSWRHKMNNNNNNKNNDYPFDSDSDDGDYAEDFNDRIFVVDTSRLLEIYNPKKEDGKYFELPAQNQEDSADDDDDKSSLKRRRREEDSADDSTSFALTGPDEGIMICDNFDVVVHKDDPANDHDYIERATDAYLSWRLIEVDKSTSVLEKSLFYDVPRTVKVDLEPDDVGSLKLDYVVILDSKLVTVVVKWLVEGTTDNDNHMMICGKVTVFSEEHSDFESVLLLTPKDKAAKVKHDNLIPLSRSVVAVPYKSAFTVEADLHNPINGSSAQVAAKFPFKKFYKDGPSFYVATDETSVGIGGKIRVEVTVER